jgi:CubicO group peptidase (beta-lactamase class C family)
MAPGDAVAAVPGEDGILVPHRLNKLRGGPAGGAFAPAADLLRFANALQSGKLVSMDQLQAMTRFQTREADRGDAVPRGWGLGFGLASRNGILHFGHVGGIPGAGAALRMREDRARTVVALADQDMVDAPRASSLAMAAALRLADCGYCDALAARSGTWRSLPTHAQASRPWKSADMACGRRRAGIAGRAAGGVRRS